MFWLWVPQKHLHSFGAVPGHVPLPVDQQMDVFNAAVVGVVQSLRQVLLQVGLKVLVCFLTLENKKVLLGFKRDIREMKK